MWFFVLFYFWEVSACITLRRFFLATLIGQTDWEELYIFLRLIHTALEPIIKSTEKNTRNGIEELLINIENYTLITY